MDFQALKGMSEKNQIHSWMQKWIITYDAIMSLDILLPTIHLCIQ